MTRLREALALADGDLRYADRARGRRLPAEGHAGWGGRGPLRTGQGRQGEALAAYQEARAGLQEGLGIDPGSGLQVLVVDQAEEALLADDGRRLVPFGDRVLAAIVAGVRVVLVLRADFFGRLVGHAELARRAGPATVLVGPPDERDLRRIVTEPAARVGLRVEPALVDLVVAEVRDRPGVLPILSAALVRTWEKRDGDLLSVASYRAGGGVAAALESVG